MERALKPFPQECLMEGQVLESHMEIAQVAPSMHAAVRRRPWGSRRRTRSTGSLPFVWHHKPSDDSSSSVGGDPRGDKGLSSIHQSDSDDVQDCSNMFSLQDRRHLHLVGNMESDSVNENFSPIRPSTRRKRKFKRMAVDVEMASTSVRPPMSCMIVSSGKKKRVLRHVPNCDNRYCVTGASCGKRKRSVRTESPRVLGFATPAVREDTTSALHRLSLRDAPPPQPMEVSIVTATPAPSSSSLSSSESDTGVFTNDEGREGDDEQSDWFGEAVGAKGWWADSDRDEDMEPTFQAILTGNLEQMSERAKQTYRMLADRMGKSGGREIRGGRRRVRAEKPGFSVLTSANEKLSKFLQDPAQSELRLHPMQKKEREQLCHLADLYSLNMRLSEPSRKGLTCPVLTKTSNTVRVEQLPLSRLSTLGDFKRRRKTPPSGHFSSPPDVDSANTKLLRSKNIGHKSS
ncbi:G patch domain-containing protein 2 [Homalodisca vitripennis]|uniref:Uncharacterized protein n=3 Tax=Proconiini TaxID=565685 RepID=A0A1B6JWZ8_9HEMI|nr:G patch domain-containing protein 2 [Homalodisca vitripennis]